MSVFHRVEDPMQLGSSRYFLFAERLHFYEGAMRGALLAEQNNTQTAQTAVQPPRDAPQAISAAPGEEVRYIDVDDVQQLVSLSNQGGFAGFEYVGG